MLLLEQILVAGLGAGVKVVGRVGLTHGERRGQVTSIGLKTGLTWFTNGVSLSFMAWRLVPTTSLRSFLEPVKILDVVVEIVDWLELGTSFSESDFCEMIGCWFDSKWWADELKGSFAKGAI